MRRLAGALAFLVLDTGGVVLMRGGQEQKLKSADVPAAVRSALTAQYPGAHVTGWTKELEDGKTTYEASVTDNGAKRDVVFGDDGSLVAVEQAIQVSALPDVVKQAIRTKYPTASLKSAEKITKGDELQYEVDLSKASKKEVLLSSDGKILKEE